MSDSDFIPSKQKSLTSGLLPVLGFVLALCFGAIAWVSSQPAVDWVDNNVRGFNAAEFDPVVLQVGFGLLIFFVLAAVGGVIAAIAMPRKKSTVREKDLMKERQAVLKEKRQRKKRQLEMAKARQRANNKNKK